MQLKSKLYDITPLRQHFVQPTSLDFAVCQLCQCLSLVRLIRMFKVSIRSEPKQYM